MKKLLILLLILCLAATAAAMAEEGGETAAAEGQPGAPGFDSFWVSGDAQVRVDARQSDDGYEILIVGMTGENAFDSWEYVLAFDGETESLVADGTGMKSANTFDETGVITSSVYEYEDGSARFFINEAGQLCWSDEKEPAPEAAVFNRIGRFPGQYTGGGGQLKVCWAGEDRIYDVWLDMPEDDLRTWHWTLSGTYDPAAETLTLNGVRLLYTRKDDGELDPDADKLAEEVSAVFAFDGEGCLVVPESTDPAIMGIQYERDPMGPGMWEWVF